MITEVCVFFFLNMNSKLGKMRNLVKTFLICLSVLSIYSCSSDDGIEVISSEFVTANKTGFFINQDGSVNLSINAVFSTGNDLSGDVVSRGFVYGITSKAIPNTNNIEVVTGSQDEATGYIQNLVKGENYFIRGYFELSDGTYFYGNEIQVKVDVDASSTRELVMTMESKAYWFSSTEITVQVNLTEVEKEMPSEIGFEYSLNSDFSNSTIIISDDYKGLHQQGTLLVTYFQELLSGLSPSTTYYFRPYAKYADGVITTGGTSTASYTTSEKVSSLEDYTL